MVRYAVLPNLKDKSCSSSSLPITEDPGLSHYVIVAGAGAAANN